MVTKEQVLPSESMRQATCKALIARCDLPTEYRDGSNAELGQVYRECCRLYNELDEMAARLRGLGV